MPAARRGRHALAAAAALALAALLSACGGGGSSGPQPPPADAGTLDDPTAYSALASAALPEAVDATSERHLQLALGARTLAYTARAGHLVVPDAAGRAQASMFHVAYTLDGQAAAQRPVVFFYNGGPGSASAWLHLGSFAPRRLAVGTPVPSAAPPYPLVDNAQTLLDAADLVFVDAVGTGYSQAVAPYVNQSFWGVDADAALFRDFVQRWLAVRGRQASPKFLYGESYGGPRTAVLAELLEAAGVRLAGVVLQSPALDYTGNCGLDTTVHPDCRGTVPSYGAVALYHRRTQPDHDDLPAFMQTLRGYVDDTYQRALDLALQQGQPLAPEVAAQLAADTGLTAAAWRTQRVIGPDQFMTTLLPGRRLGRYDGRMTTTATAADDPSIDTLDASVYQRLGELLRNELGYRNASVYVLLGNAIDSWDFSHAGRPLPDTVPDLAAARLLNPQLRVLAMSGYHDLATPFHQTELDLARLPGAGNPVSVRSYTGGHMSYLDDETRRAQRADLGLWLAGQPPAAARATTAAARGSAAATPPATAATATPAPTAAATAAPMPAHPALPAAAVQTTHRDPWLPDAARAAARTQAAAAAAEPARAADDQALQAQALQAQAEARLRARFDAAAGPGGRLTRAQARAAGLGAVARALDERGAAAPAALTADEWLAHLRAGLAR